MHGLLHRHPCRKEFKKMEMLFDATGTMDRKAGPRVEPVPAWRKRENK